MFHVGQKVVCVQAEPSSASSVWLDGQPIEGHVYTIAETGVPSSYGHPYMCVRLVELTRASNPPYRASRFRPLVSLSTASGMAILEGVRRDAERKVRERA